MKGLHLGATLWLAASVLAQGDPAPSPASGMTMVFEFEVGKTELPTQLRKSLTKLFQGMAAQGMKGNLQDDEMLPIRGRTYVDFGQVKDTPFGRVAPLVTVIDSRKAIGDELLAPYVAGFKREGDSEWTDGFATVARLPPVAGRHRIVYGYGTRGFGASKWNAALPEPKLDGNERAMRARLTRRSAWLFARLKPFAKTNPQLRSMLGLLGPGGLTMGLSVFESEGRLAMALESGLRPGSGTIGMFLPREAPNAQPFGAPPFVPNGASLIDLGDEAERLLKGPVLGLTAALEPELAKGLRTLFQAWDGRHASYNLGIERMAGYFPLSGESDEDLTKLLVGILRRSPRLKDVKVRDGVHLHAAGPFVLAWRVVSGMFTLATAPTEEQAFADVTAGGKRETPRPAALRSAKGPVKLWLGKWFVDLVRSQAKAVGPKGDGPYAAGFRLGQEFVFRLIEDGLTVSVEWDAAATRVVLRF